MNAQPLVSVLMRTRDRQDLLREALVSVLAQTWPAIETVIVNDGGEDVSDAVIPAGSAGIRWINNPGPHGRSHAANLALAQARGHYCLFLDDDDLLDPGHVEGLVRALQSSPGHRIAYSAVRTMTDGVIEDNPSFAHPYDPVRLMIENFIPIHAVLFERAAAGDSVCFDPAFNRFEDWDFWLQLATDNDFLYVDKCTATYRVAKKSGFGAKDIDSDDLARYRLALYRKWLPRWPESRLLELIDRSREYPRIEVLETAVSEQQANIEEKLGYITILREHETHLTEQVGAQQRVLVETNKQLEDMSQELQYAEHERQVEAKKAEALQNELHIIYNSRSWKLTRPLRFFTKIRFFVRTEGVRGLLTRIRIKLGARTQRARKIAATAPVSDHFHPLAFPKSGQPQVSIVIPVFNKYQYSFHCLKSVLDNLGGENVEVIVVDDCSTDKTAAMLADISGIKVIRNPQNQGFIASCNNGAAAARGEFLVLLNNDTEVREGWLAALRRTFSDFPDAGLVGARLVFPDGTLQEAGGIVWMDGSAWNYGRGQDPNHPDYAYCRQVDYCSGACLMIRLADYRALGGFDNYYAPAYYEDTDLAFRVREAGKKVYYQPNATIIHFEGITSGTDTGSGIKQYQVTNADKFCARWRETLASHRPNGRLPELEKERHVNKRILVIDARVLMPDHDSGSLRMFNILRILQRLGYKVVFVPANLHYHEKYTPLLQGQGIECHYLPHDWSVGKYLEIHGRQFDAAILSRADYAEKFIDDVRRFCPNARVLFDTVDLHFLREQREAELTGDQKLRESAAIRKNQELNIARKADVTLVVSPVELDLFRAEAPDVHVSLLSNIHEPEEAGPPFGERRDMLFIGNFEHPPNTDAMNFFLDEVFSLVLEQQPDLKLYIVGGHVPSHLKARAGDNVVFTGMVADIRPLFDGVKLSIAPLRYGAGVKGKINTSMAFGVPAVVTSVAAEGMNLVHGKDILVADAPADFAREILRLYGDETLWRSLAEAGRRNIEEHFSFAAAEAQLRAVL